MRHLSDNVFDVEHVIYPTSLTELSKTKRGWEQSWFHGDILGCLGFFWVFWIVHLFLFLSIVTGRNLLTKVGTWQLNITPFGWDMGRALKAIACMHASLGVLVTFCHQRSPATYSDAIDTLIPFDMIQFAQDMGLYMQENSMQTQ